MLFVGQMFVLNSDRILCLRPTPLAHATSPRQAPEIQLCVWNISAASTCPRSARLPRAHPWLRPDARVKDLSGYKAEGFFSGSGRMWFKTSAGKAKRLHPGILAVFPECSELGWIAEHLLKRVGSLDPLPGAGFCSSSEKSEYLAICKAKAVGLVDDFSCAV